MASLPSHDDDRGDEIGNDLPPPPSAPPLEEVGVLSDEEDDGSCGESSSTESSLTEEEEEEEKPSFFSNRRSMMGSDRRGRRRRRSRTGSIQNDRDGNRPTAGGTFRDLLNRSSLIEPVRTPRRSNGGSSNIMSPQSVEGIGDETTTMSRATTTFESFRTDLDDAAKDGSTTRTIVTVPSSLSSISTLSPFPSVVNGGVDDGDDVERRSPHHDDGAPPEAEEEERRDDHADDDGAEEGGRESRPPPRSSPRFSCGERRRRPRWLTAGGVGVGEDVSGSNRGESTATHTKQDVASVPASIKAGDAESMILFGRDISSLSPAAQFGLCASGVFGFTIVYGYLQELLAVHIAGRRYALFLASVQFGGYAFWSAVLRGLHRREKRRERGEKGGGDVTGGEDNSAAASTPPVPLRVYVGLSLLRSLDLGLTNGAMRYLNYPAKTLIKSSRVAFTMMLGLVIGKRKTYRARDYAAVAMLVIGLGVFLHADATGDAVFHPVGVAMLVVSLTCDGVVANWSEVIMRKHAISQDEFQARLYSIAFLATTFAAHVNGELLPGVRDFLLRDGTVEELRSLDEARVQPTSSWTPAKKATVLVLFATTGLFGSSCAGAITKRFGALSMSVTSTARKATTLFLSFAAFTDNRCTPEHVAGMGIFLTALFGKAACAKRAADEERRQSGGGDSVPVTRKDSAILAHDDGVECPSCERSVDDLEEGFVEIPTDCDDSDDDEEMNPLVGGKASSARGGAETSLFEAARSSRRLGSVLRIVGIGGRRQRQKWSKLENMSSGATHLS